MIKTEIRPVVLFIIPERGDPDIEWFLTAYDFETQSFENAVKDVFDFSDDARYIPMELDDANEFKDNLLEVLQEAENYLSEGGD